MRLAFPVSPLAVVAICAAISCRTGSSSHDELSLKDAGSTTSLTAACAAPIELGALRQQSWQCLRSKGWNDPQEMRKRQLPAAIPCNAVRYVTADQDLLQLQDAAGARVEGGSGLTELTSLMQSQHYRVFKDWLGAADRFAATDAEEVFGPQRDSKNAGNPILDNAFMRTIKELIADAKHTIFMDIFLLGGSGGREIYKQLLEASDRGVDVLILHDNVSKFSVANEMDPLWQRAKTYSLDAPWFTALDAEISPKGKPSGLPFGFDKITRYLDPLIDSSVSIRGHSDHSKILLIDAFPAAGPDDLWNQKPQALIMSHNLVDSAAAFYHDEGIVVTGPGAVAAALDYQPDIALAIAKAEKSVPAPALAKARRWLDKLVAMQEQPLRLKGFGNTAVSSLAVAADDSVRNLDVSILKAVAEAKSSIDLYGRIAYNPPLANALRAAMDRGVKLRIILDQQIAIGSEANALLPYMMSQGDLTREAELAVRWHLPFRPGYSFNKNPERSDLAQEIHAKTIIVDGQKTLFGSVNMDSVTWAGGFREYAVWVDDAEVAAQASRTFSLLWEQPFLTIGHKAWLGFESPDPRLLALAQQAEAEGQARGCKDPHLCRFDGILAGGKVLRTQKARRELAKRIITTEAARIKLAEGQDLLESCLSVAEGT